MTDGVMQLWKAISECEFRRDDGVVVKKGHQKLAARPWIANDSCGRPMRHEGVSRYANPRAGIKTFGSARTAMLAADTRWPPPLDGGGAG